MTGWDIPRMSLLDPLWQIQDRGSVLQILLVFSRPIVVDCDAEGWRGRRTRLRRNELWRCF